MRVTNDTAYRSLLRDLERISERMQTAQIQISSGKKLHNLSDDPTAASDVVRISSEQSEIAQYLDNVATAKSRLAHADVTLMGVQDTIGRILTLAQRGLSGNAEVHTNAIKGERDSLLAAANRTMDGQFIFAGSNVNQQPYVQASDGTVSYQGDGEATRLQVGRSLTLQVHVPGSEVFSGAIDIFETIDKLVTAMNAGRTGDMDVEIRNLHSFSTNLGNALVKVGGLENLADSIESGLNQSNIARTASRSRLEDADLAVALTDYTQSETALRAATAAGARISNISLLDYLR